MIGRKWEGIFSANISRYRHWVIQRNKLETKRIMNIKIEKRAFETV